LPRIGFLAPFPRPADGPLPAWSARALLEGLEALGWVDGKTFVGEYRYAEKAEQLPELAAELVRADPDVLVTLGAGQAAQAAGRATATIPIVAIAVSNLVQLGLVESVARPGGNLTGLSGYDPRMPGKRLQLLKEAVPRAARVGVVWNPASTANQADLKTQQAIAPSLGVRLESILVQGNNPLLPFEAALAGDRPDALIVTSDPILVVHAQRIVEAVNAGGLPALYHQRQWVEAGGLMAYGPDNRAIFRRAAYYVDRILRGARPADLPVEDPTVFEFSVNRATAQSIGLTFPESVLQQITDFVA
jgi:putative ABC transport system substrate-binding protein